MPSVRHGRSSSAPAPLSAASILQPHAAGMQAGRYPNSPPRSARISPPLRPASPSAGPHALAGLSMAPTPGQLPGQQQKLRSMLQEGGELQRLLPGLLSETSSEAASDWEPEERMALGINQLRASLDDLKHVDKGVAFGGTGPLGGHAHSQASKGSGSRAAALAAPGAAEGRQQQQPQQPSPPRDHSPSQALLSAILQLKPISPKSRARSASPSRQRQTAPHGNTADAHGTTAAAHGTTSSVLGARAAAHGTTPSVFGTGAVAHGTTRGPLGTGLAPPRATAALSAGLASFSFDQHAKPSPEMAAASIPAPHTRTSVPDDLRSTHTHTSVPEDPWSTRVHGHPDGAPQHTAGSHSKSQRQGGGGVVDPSDTGELPAAATAATVRGGGLPGGEVRGACEQLRERMDLEKAELSGVSSGGGELFAWR